MVHRRSSLKGAIKLRRRDCLNVNYPPWGEQHVNRKGKGKTPTLSLNNSLRLAILIYYDHTVHGAKHVLVMSIRFRFIQPFIFIYQVFEFMLAAFGKRDIRTKISILLSTHVDHGLPV